MFICNDIIAYIVANCGHPESLFTVSNDSDYKDSRSVPNIDGYDGLPIKGSTIMFSCPPGLELIGSNSSTCTENGEWEPDPKGIVCNDSSSDTEGYVLQLYTEYLYKFIASYSAT